MPRSSVRGHKLERRPDPWHRWRRQQSSHRACRQSGRVIEVSRGEGINPIDNRAWRRGLEAQLRPFAGGRGLAGVAAALPAYGEVEEISADQREVIAAAFGTVPQRVLNDVDAAQIGAFGGGAGILILSGTGSMAWARDAAGRSYRVGGWGETIGDEGSSHWIGRRMLGLVSQSIDGRAGPTPLVDAVFEHLQLDRTDPVNALEGWVSRLKTRGPESPRWRRSPIASPQPGTPAPWRSSRQAAEELARHVRTIAAPAFRPAFPWRGAMPAEPSAAACCARPWQRGSAVRRSRRFCPRSAVRCSRPRNISTGRSTAGLDRASCRLNSGRTYPGLQPLNNKPGEQGHACIHPIGRCSDGAHLACRPRRRRQAARRQIHHGAVAVAAGAEHRSRLRERDRHPCRSADPVLGRHPAQAGDGADRRHGAGRRDRVRLVVDRPVQCRRLVSAAQQRDRRRHGRRYQPSPRSSPSTASCSACPTPTTSASCW